MTSQHRDLENELSAALRDAAGVRAVYLFGSALQSDSPHDIDLIVVYEEPLTPLSAPSVRPLIDEAVRAGQGLAAHVMFFTVTEAQEPESLSVYEAQLVYGTPV
jgi:hypothetical protein